MSHAPHPRGYPLVGLLASFGESGATRSRIEEALRHAPADLADEARDDLAALLDHHAAELAEVAGVDNESLVALALNRREWSALVGYLPKEAREFIEAGPMRRSSGAAAPYHPDAWLLDMVLRRVIEHRAALAHLLAHLMAGDDAGELAPEVEALALEAADAVAAPGPAWAAIVGGGGSW